MEFGSGYWKKWLSEAWQRWEYDNDDKMDFGPPADGRTTLLEDSVNTSSTLDPGELWAGSGNTPFNFSISENQSEGVEIALKAKVRQSGDEVPYDPLTNTYLVPTGPQDVANGSSSSNPDRAAWNFDFSVNGDTDDDGVLPDGSRVRLEFDVDISEDVDYRTIADASFQDFLTSGLVAGSPDETVFDGSQNPAFGFIADLFPESAPYDQDDPGFYNIRLSYLSAEGDDDDDDVDVLASVEITVNVIGVTDFQEDWLI